MVRQLIVWLGPVRVRLLVAALALTGFASAGLSVLASGESWSISAQTLLVLIFVAGAAVIVGSNLPRPAQARLVLTVGPALGLAAISLLLPERLFTLLLGLAFGWLLAAQFLFRDRMRMEYRTAIRHLRQRNYTEAIRVITEVIKTDQRNPDHYRFRAELNRLAGRMGPAIRDYEEVVRLDPESAVGYNGLAEVYLQQGDHEKAKSYGAEAYRREPTYWVAPYNLGMIEDRLGESEAAIQHLSAVLQGGLPDSRHRLLTYLWLARAHYRLGQTGQADEALAKLKRETKGLQEWEIIFKDEQAEVLRKVLEEDVKLAERVHQEGVGAETLFGVNVG